MTAVVAEISALINEYWTLMGSNDFASVQSVLSEHFILEWPQSNERIRGAARFAQMNSEYPAHGPWRFTVNRVVANANDEAVSDVTVTDGVLTARAISFFSVEAGKISKIVEYWPEPMPRPPTGRTWLNPTTRRLHIGRRRLVRSPEQDGGKETLNQRVQIDNNGAS